MLDGLKDALAAIILWFRGVGMGDRLDARATGRGTPGDAHEPGAPEADGGRAPTRQRAEGEETGTAPPLDDLIAAHARAEHGTGMLKADDPDDGEGNGGPRRAPTTREWMTALLDDHGIAGGAGGLAELAGPGTKGTGLLNLPGGGPAIAGRSATGPLAPGQRLPMLELVGNPRPETLAALRNFPPGLVVPGTPEYRELVHVVFDTGKLHLLQRLAAEPLFPYACRMWKPGRRDANLELAHALHERLGKLMGSLFNFDPAPLATGTAMQRRLHACYDETTGQLYLSGRHLAGTLPDLMEAMAHQQTHCLQHAFVKRLAEGADLSDAHRALVGVWTDDFKRWQHTCLPLGIGYHALDLGRSVGKLFQAMEVEERLNPSGPTPA